MQQLHIIAECWQVVTKLVLQETSLLQMRILTVRIMMLKTFETGHLTDIETTYSTIWLAIYKLKQPCDLATTSVTWVWAVYLMSGKQCLSSKSIFSELLWFFNVRRPCVRPSTISLNNISSETTYWILTKLLRNNPWVVPYQSCSNRSSWLHK